MAALIDQVAAVIRSHRYVYTDEDELQEGIAAVLDAASLQPKREVRLNARDRLDVLVAGIAIEVKTKGSKSSLFSQLSRYAEHDEVDGLIAVINKPFRLPDEVGGKPLLTVSLVGSGL